jgi:hypothetical protein
VLPINEIPSGAVVQGHHDSYLIACASETELENWMKAIETNIFKNPFLELIKKKMAIQRYAHGCYLEIINKEQNLFELRIG